MSYQATFTWPHSNANNVVVTGTFDNWTSSHSLTKSDSGFSGTIPLPYSEKVFYKYLVDGHWITSSDEPSEADHSGNVNNVLVTPAPPVPEVPVPAPQAQDVVELAPEVEASLPPQQKVQAHDVPQPSEAVEAPVTQNQNDELAESPDSTTSSTLTAVAIQVNDYVKPATDAVSKAATDVHEAYIAPALDAAAAKADELHAAHIQPVVDAVNVKLAEVHADAILPALDKVQELHATVLQPALEQAKQSHEEHVKPVLETVNPVVDHLTGVAALAVPAAVASVTETVVDVHEKVAPVVQPHVEAATEGAKETIQPVLEQAQTAVLPALEKIQEVLQPVTDKVPEHVQPLLDAHKETLTEVRETVTAAEGTHSAITYIASGVGAALAGVTGIDPVNPPKIPVSEELPLEKEVAPPVVTEAEPLKEVQEVLTAPVSTNGGPKHVPMPETMEPISEPPAEDAGAEEFSSDLPSDIPEPAVADVTGTVDDDLATELEASQAAEQALVDEEDLGVVTSGAEEVGQAPLAPAVPPAEPVSAPAEPIAAVVEPLPAVEAAKEDSTAPEPIKKDETPLPPLKDVSELPTPVPITTAPQDMSFPTTESGPGSGPASEASPSPSGEDKRKKRQSLFGKIKATFSKHK